MAVKKDKKKIKKTSKSSDSEAKKSGVKLRASEKISRLRDKPDISPQKKQAELEEAKKENLYLRAEFENFKKRSLETRLAFQKYEGERLLVLLANEVFDDYERALSSAKDHKSFDELYKGLQMIQKKLNMVLKNFGVEVLDPTGEAFDPSFQEAMGSIDSKLPPGHVVNAFRKAYKLHDKIVRTAQVILSKEEKKEDDTD